MGPRLKGLFNRPTLTHLLALLIGVSLAAGLNFVTGRKQNEPNNPCIPAAARPEDAAIAKDQRDKTLMAFAEELDPEWLFTSFSMKKAETGQWVDICKIDGTTKGTFYMAAVEVTRDVRIGDGTIEKDRKGKCFVFLKPVPGDVKAIDAKDEGIFVEPPAAVFGSLASEVGKTMRLRLETNKEKKLERHIFLRLTDIPAASYEVTVRLYSMQSSLLNWSSW
jgi:hypothetical protein